MLLKKRENKRKCNDYLDEDEWYVVVSNVDSLGKLTPLSYSVPLMTHTS